MESGGVESSGVESSGVESGWSRVGNKKKHCNCN